MNTDMLKNRRQEGKKKMKENKTNVLAVISLDSEAIWWSVLLPIFL